MSNAASFFTRVLADIFPGKSNNLPQATSPTAKPPTWSAPSATPTATVVQPAPRVIGQGATNEAHVTIAGVPNLFVDEGDCVVQFIPAFDEAMQETHFGIKVLPELAPHWTEAATHRCSLKEAIAKAIRGHGQRGVPAPMSPAVSNPAGNFGGNRAASPREQLMPDEKGDEDVPRFSARQARSQYGGNETATVSGTIVAWGEEQFPRRQPGGARFYTSFALRLQTLSGERVLQGEGLKDAICESGCQVGDVVSVRRLRKIQVQAFNSDGTPKTRNGAPVLWDKWLWSISL
ncbi:hypothetical protein LFL96_34660 (plasmid) [Paraburkholderia sp. D15]|uniref:hypothetical protein n=1 Tax=Paraburkholderia sp. D15 TaxID=2880218 RepID=UPI002479A0D1|nr:hypothetical protein [Paraburkholderia sp. D15]WGS55095.1 hypothetical protein LFL96_34660 [Paraburkholderia sp. D15]